MSKYYSFDEKAISDALEAAERNRQRTSAIAKSTEFDLTHGGEISLFAQCVSVTVENNHVCVNLPLGLGSKCISIPLSIPNGTAGKACLNICTTWGIPTGVRVSVEIGGVTVVNQTFGKC
ncbi:MAG: hypothetical protein HEP71_15795 [Roseivirga sp.]|nr:hypothetical protein [Roseivirga sp.]